MCKMKITINRDFKGSIYNSLREAGYHPDKKQRGREASFSRSLLGETYPRFHIYYNEDHQQLNLHLDHKAPRYDNAPDHGAEYNGRLVEEEAQRLQNFFCER